MLAVAALAGTLHASALVAAAAKDCRRALQDGQALQVAGTVVSAAGGSRVAVQADEGLPGGCRAAVRVRLPRDVAVPPTGAAVRAEGRWLAAPLGAAGDPERSGELRAERVVAWEGGARSGGPDRWRAALAARVEQRFPTHAGLVAALVLARRDGLDRGVRDAFARTGVAHLLAISGFHVGVVAGLVLALLRALRVGRGPAAAMGALAVWLYVLLIGAPDAAARAAVILTLAAAGRMLGRPLLSAGTLATALLALLLIDPGGLARPGFQLSFAGAAGLALAAPVVEETLQRVWPAGRARGLRSGVVAGVAATLATLPIVAWHFDRVSLVGVPVTLVATPLVATAIPGILGALALDALGAPGAASFLAGGVELLLDVLVRAVEGAAGLPLASVWATRGGVAAGAVGAVVTLALLTGARGLGTAVRGATVAAGVAAAVLLRPLSAGPVAAGTLEVRVLDVGQGDAVLLRSPRGAWVLVDTGPGPPPDFASAGGAGEDRAPPTNGRLERLLRRQGVTRLRALVLTHPHLDHIGEAAALLGSLRVDAVVGPGQASGSGPYLAALSAAAAHGVRWVEVRRGDRLDVDGMKLAVLHPRQDPLPGEDPNDASVVLLLSWGSFRALLTGDAPARVEEALAAEAGDLDVLKVAHHGSRTSTSAAFLDAARPEVAFVSAGRANRYGHPHGEVVDRLERAGVRVLRTDRDGEIRLRVDRLGAVEVPDPGV